MEKKIDLVPSPKVHPENKIPVDDAILHSACTFSGGRVESTLNGVKVPGIKMWWIKQEGLYFTCKHQEGLIPHANVKIVYFRKNVE